MNTPYRDVQPTEDDDTTIIDKIHPPDRLGRGLLRRTLLTLAGVGVLALLGDFDSIVTFLLRHYVPVLIAGLILFLEKPVRTRLERRYARKVARGIIELEARAARLDAEPNRR